MSSGSQVTLILRLLQAELPDTYLLVNWMPEFHKHSLTFEKKWHLKVRLVLTCLTFPLRTSQNPDKSRHHSIIIIADTPLWTGSKNHDRPKPVPTLPLTCCWSRHTVHRCLSKCLNSPGHFLSISFWIWISSPRLDASKSWTWRETIRVEFY